MEKVVRVAPRYHRWHVDPGVEWVEANTGYAYLDWEIPLSQAALVLVDVWDRHYLRDTEARAEKIIRERTRPRCGLDAAVPARVVSISGRSGSPGDWVSRRWAWAHGRR